MPRVRKSHLIQQIRDRARPFDLLFTWSKGLIGEGISGFTGGGPSHVMLLKLLDEPKREVWHVTAPRCRWDRLERVINFRDHYRVELGRNRKMVNAGATVLSIGRARAMELIGTPYDYAELLIEHLMDELGLDSTDQSDPELFVCSSGAEAVFAAMKRPMRPDEELVSPQDQRNSVNYEPLAVWEL